MKQREYYLHAILVHTGFADGGHYFTYIYDRVLEEWRKYSDIAVSSINEEDVFDDSLGGKGLTSAYCLLYIDEETAKFGG
jgi:ubiquitin carboxyl-terminal hydrolase 34